MYFSPAETDVVSDLGEVSLILRSYVSNCITCYGRNYSTYRIIFLGVLSVRGFLNLWILICRSKLKWVTKDIRYFKSISY